MNKPRFATTVEARSPQLPDADGRARSLAAYLQRRTPGVLSEWPARPAAVLVPLFLDRGEWKVLFTRRTESVESHRGQVSFPGGQLETGVETAVQAALREAEEEIGLRPADVTVLGVLDSLLTVTQFLVTPIVAHVPWPYDLKINPHEVARAFSVPVAWLSEPANVESRARPSPMEGPSPLVSYFQPFDGEVIWGATARITLQLLEAWRESRGG